MADLTGSIIIVTGASSGIGEATARLLHKVGARPVLAARRADRLERLSAELGGALAVPTDVTDPAQISRLIEATLTRHGTIDALINSAGVALHHQVAEVDPAELTRALAVNVVGLVAMTQAVLPAMRNQCGGWIVNISSGTTRAELPGIGPYAATKSAVNMLTAVSREELHGDGIGVSLVVPSITATEFNGGGLRAGAKPRPGMVVHSAEYVAAVILRVLRTGVARVAIPHGPEQPKLADYGAWKRPDQ